LGNRHRLIRWESLESLFRKWKINADPEDFDSDPILEANELKDRTSKQESME